MGVSADLLTRWFDEVWNRGNAEAIDELLAPDATLHGLAPGDLIGPEAFRAFHASFTATFSDIEVSIERTVEEGERVSAWCSVTATHRDSGRAVTFSGSVLGSIQDGKLQEGWNSWDFLSLLVQLGAVDAEAVAPLLGGPVVSSKQPDRIPALIRRLFAVCSDLESEYPGRPFTPDGHPLGSIGEVLAAARYGLDLHRPSKKGRDARTSDGVMVEVKATAAKKQGSTRVAFREVPVRTHVLVVRVTSNGEMHEEFNGPGAVLVDHLSPARSNGQRTISLARLRRLQNSVPETDRLQPIT